MFNKKGVSGVVTVMLLIVLVIVVVGVVWGVVTNIVEKGLGDAEACFGIFGEVTINSRYTCYNSSSSEVQFGISIGDIELNKVFVKISSVSESSTFEIDNNLNNVANLMSYSGAAQVELPEKNSGKTYIASGFSNKPDLIEIVPVVSGKTCKTSDSLSELDDCSVLA